MCWLPFQYQASLYLLVSSVQQFDVIRIRPVSQNRQHREPQSRLRPTRVALLVCRSYLLAGACYPFICASFGASAALTLPLSCFGNCAS